MVVVFPMVWMLAVVALGAGRWVARVVWSLAGVGWPLLLICCWRGCLRCFAGLLVLPTVRALRWTMRVPLLMYWVSLPLVSPLAPGVSAGEGVVAFDLPGLGLGIGAGAGVRVVATGHGYGFGRGWSFGVAGWWRSPLLAEGLVGAAGPSTPVS